MESTGILNTDNPIHVFTLHLIFIPRINKALDEFCEAKVRTEGNWSPYEMLANGMFLHADNTLAHGLLDEEPHDMEIYGYDLQGPSPTGSDNHVVIIPVDISRVDLLKSFVLEHLDPLRPSTGMGTDIYTEALDLELQRLEQLADSGTYVSIILLMERCLINIYFNFINIS